MAPVTIQPLYTATATSHGGRNGHVRSDNGVIVSGLWECSAGRMRADFGNDGEMVHVVKGTLHAIADDGTEHVLRPGDTATFPPYWTGVWVLDTPMRKMFCVFDFL